MDVGWSAGSVVGPPPPRSASPGTERVTCCGPLQVRGGPGEGTGAPRRRRGHPRRPRMGMRSTGDRRKIVTRGSVGGGGGGGYSPWGSGSVGLHSGREEAISGDGVELRIDGYSRVRSLGRNGLRESGRERAADTENQRKDRRRDRQTDRQRDRERER